MVEMPQSHAAQLASVYILMGFKECTIIIEVFLATHFHIFLLCCYEEYDNMSGGLDIYWLQQLHVFI